MSQLQLRPLHPSKPQSFEPSRFSHSRKLYNDHLQPFNTTHNYPAFVKLTHITYANNAHHGDKGIVKSNSNHGIGVQQETCEENNFWAAVSLIIGTAVGPGMLGLPSATIKSGPLPSTFAILLSWVYVISSIMLVAELSFAAMEEDGVKEVSFTGLATKALGSNFGAFVALVHASLTFALLVACVSGIGSIVSNCFPKLNLVTANALFPLTVGVIILFFPFKIIDGANRFLCLFMLLSISSLVGFGLAHLAQTNILASFSYASWRISYILPAIPVTVLTLGFHVITPFICKLCGNRVSDARKAILIGGAVPLVMVLLWNLIVLGLSGAENTSSGDPLSLLLSVNSSTSLLAVKGFAFCALATSLIGYAVSFPKQLLDTFELIFGNGKDMLDRDSCYRNGIGRVGYVGYSSRRLSLGNRGKVLYMDSRSKDVSKASVNEFESLKAVLVMLVLITPVLTASFFPSTFSRALDFAGIYANCFLFGILPPAMAYIYQFRNRTRLSSILPGRDFTLLLLFGIACTLGIWH